MTDINKTISDIILKNILTPVIYKAEYDHAYEFFCFCDRGIMLNEIMKAETELSALLNKNVIIFDIRELHEADRVDIVKDGEIIYYEDEIIKQLFEISMLEDFRMFLDARNATVERMKNIGTPYLS